MMLKWNLDHCKKCFTTTSCQKTKTPKSLLQFTALLNQSGDQIADARSTFLKISLTTTFYLTKSKDKSETRPSKLYNKDTNSAWNCWFCTKITMKWAKFRGYWHYEIYFLKLHMCLYLHTKFYILDIILTSFKKR